MNIAVGSDGFGFALKDTVRRHLAAAGHKVIDFGVASSSGKTPYYKIASDVAQAVVSGRAHRAVLVCGTGMGMAIIANKHPGIFAAVCESTFAAEKSRSINNANVLTLGSLITTESVARNIVDIWLAARFADGWDTNLQNWLRDSMEEIGALERRQFRKAG